MYHGQSLEALHQLRLLFSFMGEENQPRALIAKGLSMELQALNKTEADLQGEYLFSMREEVWDSAPSGPRAESNWGRKRRSDCGFGNHG